MRLPRLWDRGSGRRVLIAVLGTLAAVGLVYWWQPQRYDLFSRKPERPLQRVPVENTGLFDFEKRVLVVTAHPDDEAFYLGGTLLKLRESGAKVTLVVLTDGDKGYYPFNDSETLARERQAETRDVAKRLGIEEVVFFQFPDGRLSYEDETVDRLAAELRERQPAIVFAYEPHFWPRQGHKDHRVSGEIARQAMRKAKFSGWSLYYHTVAPTSFVAVGKGWEEAQELLGMHKSQFSGEKLRMIEGIVSQNAIEYGEQFDTDFAEAFRAVMWSEGKAEGP